MFNTCKHIKRYIQLLLVVLCVYFIHPTNAFTQNFDSIQLVKTFELSAKYLKADDLGNIYAVSPTNQLYKYSSQGKLLATLNYNYTGNITSIDASNPMEIYIFYKEINRVVFLDNNLAFRGEMDLSKYNIVQASAIGRSFDNGLWVYDLGDLQLKRLDKEGNLFQSSGNIKQFYQIDFIPNLLIDNNKLVVLANDSVCLFFDVFASFIKRFKIGFSNTIQVNTTHLLQQSGNKLNIYDLKLGVVKTIKPIDTKYTPKWVYAGKEISYLYDGINCYIFSHRQ